MLRIVDQVKMSRTEYICLLAKQNWDNQDWWDTAAEAQEYLRWEKENDQPDDYRLDREQIALEEMWHEERRLLINFEAFKAKKVK